MPQQNLAKRLFIFLILLLGGFVISQLRVEWPQKAYSASSEAKLWTEKTAGEIKASGIDSEMLNRAFVTLAENNSASVVNIYTRTRIAPPQMHSYGGMAPDDLFRFFFGNPLGEGGGGGPAAREAQALGSGFVINTDGIIVTNAHVVRMNNHNADTIMVKFLKDSGQGSEATVLGVDETTDVAVIKLKKKRSDIKAAPLGDSGKLKVGEWVAAIGNPYGHTNSMTKGIVSALGRNIEELDNRADFIQTDASINPGNSGGPLFNIVGEVVGINTAIDARGQGIGFAIPINTAKGVIRQLVEKGKVTSAWIGVMLSDLSPQIAQSLGLKSIEGALIQDVVPGEPAAKAGLQSYDVVIEINGQKVDSSRKMTNLVRSIPIGSIANFRYMRDGKLRDAKVTVAQRKAEKELAREAGRSRGTALMKGQKNTGLVVGELPRQPDSEVHGVVVQGVIENSVAAQAGFSKGDLITDINRKPVHNVKEAQKLLNLKGDQVLIKVQRGTAAVIVLLDLSDNPAPNENEEEGGG